jgi:hypothetical protein
MRTCIITKIWFAMGKHHLKLNIGGPLLMNDAEFIEYALKNGFWIALRHFGIKDKTEWARLQKVMFESTKER